MAYVEGFLVPVPVAKTDAYFDAAKQAVPIFQDFGVSRFIENLGQDVPRGKVTDMYRAVKAGDDETVAFSWFEYPSRAARDEANVKMREDPRMEAMGQNMPFDGMRMVYGGFEVVVDEGRRGHATYIDGSVAPALEGSKSAYQAYAERVAKKLLELGALRVVEAWSDDVSPGKVTDFRMAVNAEDGEAIVFSWIEWPSKAARDAAWGQLMTDDSFMPQEHEMRRIDNQRRIYGGFSPILDV